MPDLLSIFLSTTLFSGFSREDAREALAALAPRQASFERGAHLLRAGDTARSIGVLLEGSALILQEDFWGNRNVLAALAPGQLFAEAFACAPESVLTVSVVAEERCQAAFLDTGRILAADPAPCPHSGPLLRNLLHELAAKNLYLNDKLLHMGQRTTRDKLLSYLSAQARRRGGPRFEIPFTRQQLADYLCVDRSGLSAELGRLQREGVLTFHKNRFTLLTGL